MHKEELKRIKKHYIEEIIDEAKDGINAQNVQMIDTMVHTAKNLCKIIEDCENEESEERYGRSYRNYGREYGREYGSDDYGDDYGARGRGRNARRDGMGRYADDDWMREKLRKMEEEAPNERMKREFREYGERMR